MSRTRRTATGFFPGDFDFEGDWYGWRLRGRLLISPHGDKLTRTRLEGIVWAEALRARYVKPTQDCVPQDLEQQNIVSREIFREAILHR